MMLKLLGSLGPAEQNWHAKIFNLGLSKLVMKILVYSKMVYKVTGLIIFGNNIRWNLNFKNLSNLAHNNKI